MPIEKFFATCILSGKNLDKEKFEELTKIKLEKIDKRKYNKLKSSKWIIENNNIKFLPDRTKMGVYTSVVQKVRFA